MYSYINNLQNDFSAIRILYIFFCVKIEFKINIYILIENIRRGNTKILVIKNINRREIFIEELKKNKYNKNI